MECLQTLHVQRKDEKEEKEEEEEEKEKEKEEEEEEKAGEEDGGSRRRKSGPEGRCNTAFHFLPSRQKTVLPISLISRRTPAFLIL